MMVGFHRSFEKDYKRLSVGVREQFKRHLALFMENPAHPLLRVHSLKGEYAGYATLNVTGDYRAMFRTVMEGVDGVVFVRIGTHSELYE